ncbi:MAG: transposase [Candidatus Methanospirareceae archaeon]
MVTGTKPERDTSWAYKFGSIYIVENGTRFTLLALPVSSESERGEEMLEIAKKLIKHARKRIEINRVYGDSWFYQVQILKTLRESNSDFIIQAPMNKKVNRILEENKDKDSIVVKDFEVKDKYSRNKEKVNFFAVKSKNKNPYAELFRRRWGIETSYRVGDDFKPKTTSTKTTVRLYYFLFSVCVYNLWVIVNMILSIVSGIIADKPLITAKRLIILLQMSMMLKGPP